MDNTLYVAMTGAKQSLAQQTIYSNNLANANTSGFKADLYQAQSVELLGAGYPSQVFGVATQSASDFKPGAIQTTGRDLDVAIDGSGWLVVETPEGTEAYTRAGDLKVNQNGLLTTANDLIVIGNGGPITIPPAEKIEIADDGSISVIPQGQGPESMAVIDRLKLVDPPLNTLKKGLDGLMHKTEGEPAQADSNVKVTTGAIEGSNVSGVEEMINMISASRQFETQLKLMQSIDENSQTLARLLQI